MFVLQKLGEFAETDRIAVVYGEKQVTYRQLNAQSDAFACYLTQTLGGDRTPIVIIGHKQTEILSCIFGALKSGRGYVPIDVTFPPDRIRMILEQISPKIVVNFTDFTDLPYPQLTAEKLAPVLSQKVCPTKSTWIRPEDIAYILFTSGSTGAPKGVTISARNICAFHSGLAPWFSDAQAGDRILNEISYSFDVAVFAIYEAISRGMTLCTADKKLLSDPKAFFLFLKQSDIRFWVSTPSLGEICAQSAQFSAELLPQLKKMIFAGEILSKNLARTLIGRFPDTAVLNAYGPTETTVLVTACRITPQMLAQEDELPIGFAFDNVHAYIADESTTPLPDGTQGELLLAGDCVSPGYFGRADLNEKAFFQTERFGRTYHTGDLCVKKGDLFYYLGRMDSQIKLNGFRIELEDVEKNLMRLANVARAVVLPEKENGRVISLTAFLMLKQDDGLGSLKRTKLLKNELSALLPEYMIPRKMVVLDAFPLNTNGKVDRKALQEGTKL